MMWSPSTIRRRGRPPSAGRRHRRGRGRGRRPRDARRPTSDSRCVAPQRSLMLRPSGGRGSRRRRRPPRRRRAVRRRWRPVGAVDDDAQPGEVAALDRADDVGDVVGRLLGVVQLGRLAGRRRQRDDLALDALLDLVGQLRAARGEQLDAVVVVRVVRRRDHRTDGVASARPRTRRRGSARRRGGGRRRPPPRARRRTPPRASPSRCGCRRRRPLRHLFARGQHPRRGAPEVEGERRRSGRCWRRPDSVGPELHVLVPRSNPAATRISAW